MLSANADTSRSTSTPTESSRDSAVAAGGAGTRLTSTDFGLTWTPTGEYYGGHLRGIAAGNGIFVATGHSWGGDDMGATTTSTDGITWTPMLETPGELGGVDFGNGIFLATGGGRCAYSTDSTAWQDCNIPYTGSENLLGRNFVRNLVPQHHAMALRVGLGDNRKLLARP